MVLEGDEGVEMDFNVVSGRDEEAWTVCGEMEL